ncbi:DUF2325 domain-containing protein [Ramlibacter sp.]|uniref:DUF2325 domain-containing protein n=1 Tax=Ramlibacter sp. TaxID=1917967 RepID=UPI003D1317FE
MCDHDNPRSIPANAGSRRRRLWELPSHSHCPVVGACLPIGTLRKLAAKALGGQPIGDDYELHCNAISECRQRGPVSEAMQRELDARYVLQVKACSVNKTAQALTAWWIANRSGSELAGTLWATLTHARCDEAVSELVLRDIHMLQHQVGSANRASLRQLDEVVEENLVLARELAAVQRRATEAQAGYRRTHEAAEAELLQVRVQLIRRDTEFACQAEELRTLEAAVPDLRERAELSRNLERQAARIHELERSLLRKHQEAERATSRAEAAERNLLRLRETAEAGDLPLPRLPRLDDRAVLCVGGRQASVPVYRRLIESIGARFLHHDGGEEESATQLDATLETADLVICQTGCISHGAYWRVKDHCKRTGKQCVFVEKPSRAGLERALSAFASDAKSPVTIPIAKAGTDA